MINELRDQLIVAGLNHRATPEDAADEALGVIRKVVREEARKHFDSIRFGHSETRWEAHLTHQLSLLYSETTVR